MTTKPVPWWRSFAGKRRKTARESAAMLEQEMLSHGTSSTIPATTKEIPIESEQQKAPQPLRQVEGGTSKLSDETYDDSTVPSTFNEGTSRRNLRVSRSGRFKEKRRMRVGLPENYEDSSNPDGKGEA